MSFEILLRLGLFLGILATMAGWEALAAARPAALPRARRWLTNGAVAVLDVLAIRLLFPAAAVGAALDAQAQGWGLFNLLPAPGWLAGILCLVVLDLAIWAQHVAFHRVPLLWRLHKVHHADRDVDVSTALRFHPLEATLSMLLKVAAVYALGAPAWAVLAFEALLNGCALFNHANVALPPAWERRVRAVLVTPEMHRIHHSVIREEHDTNFGFSVSWWDRLSGLYSERPRGGEAGLRLGLAEHQDAAPARLGWTLLLPFRRAP
ncbi:sterol desaturase family protein [Albimonas pacifica]|uniref:Sterol desaturase/sphingolipid hydroxylase, fatty acid hydroxylase superfamily n=1 Tax=Albimonas pacifica TaxID=1114924 RepID=A0A1I3LP78_9RHOB|nr:sterol desaturase family protein [Albimonas pacifica]SFI86517.1 Sterol desaturase/sphingolipid hydroxylase, fatty acid hydroxylase superfamily [Albimonas pacifica]